MNKRAMGWLIVIGIALVGCLALSLWLGPGQGIIAAVIFIGTYAAMGAGNKKAREVDEYRREWLSERQEKRHPSPDNQEPPSAD
jgi:hypothetical protein